MINSNNILIKWLGCTILGGMFLILYILMQHPCNFLQPPPPPAQEEPQALDEEDDEEEEPDVIIIPDDNLEVD